MMVKAKGKIVMDDQEIARAVTRIAHQIVEANRGVGNVVLIGIQNRGVPLAKRIAKIVAQSEKKKIPVGAIDVSLYRDDLSKKGKYIQVRKSNIPFDVTDKVVILIDDVIFAGRTARAALDGLKDYGRVAKVQLVALVDRGHRELPIHPDFVGKKIPTGRSEKVVVNFLESDGSDGVFVK
jgi:pyrimidine operon attenuation protein/uracil phosphoribosyltransferase